VWRWKERGSSDITAVHLQLRLKRQRGHAIGRQSTAATHRSNNNVHLPRGKHAPDLLAVELRWQPARIEFLQSQRGWNVVHGFRFDFIKPDVDADQSVRFKRLFSTGLPVNA